MRLDSLNSSAPDGHLPSNSFSYASPSTGQIGPLTKEVSRYSRDLPCSIGMSGVTSQLARPPAGAQASHTCCEVLKQFAPSFTNVSAITMAKKLSTPRHTRLFSATQCPERLPPHTPTHLSESPTGWPQNRIPLHADTSISHLTSSATPMSASCGGCWWAPQRANSAGEMVPLTGLQGSSLAGIPTNGASGVKGSAILAVGLASLPQSSTFQTPSRFANTSANNSLSQSPGVSITSSSEEVILIATYLPWSALWSSTSVCTTLFAALIVNSVIQLLFMFTITLRLICHA
ncbi:unnamed protein product [Protopolystoma xenopodis]|uniref:Uncharacterized protein n=1 Tax=Protopolystoma xenopodis TaxID=117903 RepID=A0A448WJ47_9PLAT|nr:unnamed protein product [Protopolystoma xenopodis]